MVELRSHMSNSRFMVAGAAAVCCVLWVPPDAVAAQSPTLAELALKEQERRKALKGTGRLLTEQDLPATTAAPGFPSAAAVAKPGPAREAAPLPASEVRDESWWRERIAQARESVRRHDIVAEALQTRINALTSDFARRDDPYQRARIADDRQKAVAELDRVRSEGAMHRKKIAEIEEEARRAGVPPGWLR